MSREFKNKSDNFRPDTPVTISGIDSQIMYVSASGGLQVLSAEGKLLGTIRVPQHVHNMAWAMPMEKRFTCAPAAGFTKCV